MANLASAAATGDRRRTLEALRDIVAQKIDEGVPARDLAPLSARLETLTRQIDELQDPEEASTADELAAQRARRRSGYSDSPAKSRSTG